MASRRGNLTPRHRPPKPKSLDLRRTLGPHVVRWIEYELCHGPGDIQGQPFELDDERVRFLLHAYAIDDRGRRLIDRAVLSRGKGWAKSEILAAVAAAEALGPVRFAGWDHDGYPLARPVRSPLIRLAATEEGQADNTYAATAFMLENGRISRTKGLDVGMTRTFLPDGGKILPITAKAASKDGGKETFAGFDEALALDTPLPTPSGWTTMGDAHVGDLLVGADGRPTTVVKTTEVQHDRVCFRVTFADGASIVASDGHVWLTRISGSAAKPRLRTTGEIFADGRRMMVPRTAPLQAPDQELLVDPYVLGLWLGDGDSRNATITVGDDDLAATTAEIERRGYTAKVCASRGRAPLVYVSVPGSTSNRHSKVAGLKPRLRDLGVLGAKHIPAAYLRASETQRLELLRGLMDADGHVSKTGHCTFSNSRRELVDQALELLRSLGQDARVAFQPDRRSRVGGCWRITFTPRGVVPFSLPRKASRVRTPAAAAQWSAIVSVEQIPSVPVRCVAVDAPDRLFVAGDGWHVTHNTHLYVTPELIRLHQVIRRNLAKRREAEPWSMETSTMYAPGELSVAELSHAYWQKIVAGAIRDPRLLFDHRQGPAEFTWHSDDELRAALIEAYGDAASWIDLERLVAEARDPQTKEADFRRYFLNQPTAKTSTWLDPLIWRARKTERTWEDIEPGTEVVLGFDGSENDDCTALVGCTVEETPHVFLVDAWVKDDIDPEWVVPRDEVDARVHWAMTKSGWKVVELAADPPRWYREIQTWADRYGEDVVISKFRTNLRSFMARACKKLHSAATNAYMTQDGDELLDQHIANAVPKVWSSDGSTYITKDYRRSPRKIDAAIAAVIAFDRATERRDSNESAYNDPGKDVLVVDAPAAVWYDEDDDW